MVSTRVSRRRFLRGADIVVSGLSTYSVYRIAETCGYSGLESYNHSWQHVDSRIEHAYGSQFWWWESGVV